MTGNEKFRLKVVDDLRKNRVIIESDEEYINLLKKAIKDLGDLVKLRDEQIAKITAERDKATQYWQIAEGRCDALMKQRDELLAALVNIQQVACSGSPELGISSDANASVKEE